MNRVQCIYRILASSLKYIAAVFITSGAMVLDQGPLDYTPFIGAQGPR